MNATATKVENPALRRMLKPAKPVTSGSRMAEAKAWRSSLPRVSENKLSAVVTVVGYDVVRTDLDAVLQAWDGYVLAILLKGPEETFGLVQIEDPVRTGLIEAQTIGRFLDTPVTGRPGTPLDAALCDHVIDAWLAGAAAAGGWTSDWKTARIIRDARAAKVALQDGEYEATEVSLSLGGGARAGLVRVLRPVAAVSAAGGPAGGSGEGGAPAFLSVEAEIRAVLHHAKVPYAWLRDLKPGTILEIPRRAIDHVQLETMDGKRITRARLGRMGDKRAVRLLDEDAPDSPAGARLARTPAVPAEPLGALPNLPDPEPLGNLPDLPEPAPASGLPGLPPIGDGD